ncbi:rhodanese-like domain-containing protein [Roseicyclus marinus]|uniref:rhodanese-like domain-containing protein n=1 Tax=Roseicyclus marinus TaxID=2161673 RepID=UPI00240FBACE|nr:rhodanese-like domain-containing protein [Roseicyclus marinus]MDG3039955.1 rhodanese-like domain-containing protein [Roseicyclus marinus]
MAETITPQEANDRVLGQGEIALIDLREPGPFSEGHPLFAVPCPFSTLEVEIAVLVPRPSCPVMLLDGGDGVAMEAAAILSAMGYTALSCVAGGAPGWAAAGLTLYKGVHVPSKTLGELAELALHPRPLAPDDLAAWRKEGRDLLFFDTRPATEHAQMTVPGAVCLPNGELVHRIDSLPAHVPIVLTCAGRTRGIVGAASLSLIEPAREVWWLEDGTQGWRLAGHALECGNPAAPLPPADAEASAARARDFIGRHGIATITAADLARWRDDPGRTTFVFDVRDPAEAAGDPVPCATPVPVVTLVQATDRFIGPRRARVVLVDDTGLRAGLAAYWLRALGHEVAVCQITTALRILPRQDRPIAPYRPVPTIRAGDALAQVAGGGAEWIDLRSSTAHTKNTVRGAIWSHRARLRDLPEGRAPFLIGDDGPRAALAAASLIARGHDTVRVVEGGLPALRDAGAEIVPGEVMNLSAAVDIISFAHGRHDGDADASRLYLAWEKGLVAQLSPEERGQFAL